MRKLLFWRKIIQAAFTLFCIFIGIGFYQYYLWITARSAAYAPRPPAVEGFLPISALISFKKLLLTGTYDPIHPAGLTIFLAALAIAFLARRGFCGWICPFGFVSDLAWKLGQVIKKIGATPWWLDYPLLSLKYLLLAFFLYIVLWKMNLQALVDFARSPYNVVADAKMLQFFLAPSNLTLWVMGVLIILSFFIRNFWCRFLCPYGALLALLSLISPMKIRRDASLCIACGKCEKTCPAAIKITRKERITTPECIGCMDCVEVCPVNQCLSLSVLQKRVPQIVLPVVVLLIFFSFYGLAVFSGNWYQEIPETVLRSYYSKAMNIQHY